MIKQYIAALICGIIGTLFFAQHDPWVHKQIGNALKATYARVFHCAVTGRVESVDFIHPRIVFSHFSLSSSSEHGNWSWTAQQYQTGFSWSFFFRNRTVDMWVSAKNLVATTDMHNGAPSITPHIKALMSVPNLPIKIILKSTNVKNAHLTITDEAIQATICWDSKSQRTAEQLSSLFNVKHGTFSYYGNLLAHALKGTVNTETKTVGDPHEHHSTLSVNVHVDVPQLAYPTCSIKGSWDSDHGRFHVQSIDKAFRINPLILSQKEGKLHTNCSASFPLAPIIKLLSKQTDIPLEGSCTLHAEGMVDAEGELNVYFTCEDLKHPWFSKQPIITCSAKKQASTISGSFNARIATASLQALFDWNLQNQHGTARVYNNTPIALPYALLWYFSPYDASLELSYHHPTQHAELRYTADATHDSSRNHIASSGTLTLDTNCITGEGSFGPYQYQLTGKTTSPYIERCSFSDHDSSLATIFYDAQRKQHRTTIAMPFIRLLGKKLFDHEIHGEGSIEIDSYRTQHNTIRADIILHNATIRLPQTYNFLNGFRASLDANILEQKFTFHHVTCTLHNGTLRMPRAVVQLDMKGNITFAHIPVLVDHCLFTVKQDLFTMLSGYLLFHKKAGDPGCISGHILFDRAQLKENLFAPQEQKKLFHAASTLQEISRLPFTCNLSLETRDPIRIDTRFLQANAELDLHLADQITKPRISGTITIPAGSINFPYKPLQISKGELRFFEDNLFNPSVQLVAKNRIKNHNITLNVAGSVQNHAILLESSPPLTDEQIVNLLLTGAHEESLNAVIPALLMQNISHVIFSSHKSDFFDTYIKPFMNRINVQLKPEFNDQTGRGGLRGALEITVNERWRALIEKNFSLTEDTRFELEYMVSDDVALRVIRDERSDIGGEVEMKWKF